MDKSERVAEIRRRLQMALQPLQLEVVDESHLHAGHAGALTGKGHFAVQIVSPQFAGKTPLARHRMIYAALGEMMDEDIHALSISANTP